MYFFRWLTIFRIGNHKNNDLKDRYPGVFFHSKGGIYVRNQGAKGAHGSLSDDDRALIKVSQEMEDDKLMFKVTLNPTIQQYTS